MAQQKLKHFVVWYEENTGMVVKYRTNHHAMERLVNKVIKSGPYVPGSMKVIVGVEVLSPDSGQELL